MRTGEVRILIRDGAVTENPRARGPIRPLIHPGLPYPDRKQELTGQRAEFWVCLTVSLTHPCQEALQPNPRSTYPDHSKLDLLYGRKSPCESPLTLKKCPHISRALTAHLTCSPPTLLLRFPW
jgi:hypothetical protein